MIRAFIFDLDGTLVQTERLKALSYARAVMEICPRAVAQAEVVEVFKDYVGRPREEVVKRLMHEFDLYDGAARIMGRFDVGDPSEAFLRLRLRHYGEMADDPQVVRDNQWPHNVELWQLAVDAGCKTALATMSPRPRVEWVLDVLGWGERFDLVLTGDDVHRGKPDPEVYLTASDGLGVAPEECMVIEDSPAGVEAAVAAGMRCIAVATPFSGERLHALGVLEERWIVDDPGDVLDVVRELLDETGGGTGLE